MIAVWMYEAGPELLGRSQKRVWILRAKFTQGQIEQPNISCFCKNAIDPFGAFWAHHQMLEAVLRKSLQKSCHENGSTTEIGSAADLQRS